MHENFSRTCQQLPKKVLIVFGAFNRRKFASEHPVTNITVSLPDQEPVTLGIVRDTENAIACVVIFCHHPEYLFYNWTRTVARHFDAAINFAASLTDTTVSPDFFERRAASVRDRARERIANGDKPHDIVGGWRLPLLAMIQTKLNEEKISKKMFNVDQLLGAVMTHATRRNITEHTLQRELDEGRSAYAYLHDKLSLTSNRFYVSKRADYQYGLYEAIHAQNYVNTTLLATKFDHGLTNGSVVSRPSMFREHAGTYMYRPSEQEDLDDDDGSDGEHELVLPENVQRMIGPGVTVRRNLQSRSKNPFIQSSIFLDGLRVDLKCITCGKPPGLKPFTTTPEFLTMSHVAGRFIARCQVCTSASCQQGWKKEPGRSGRRKMMIPTDESMAYIRSDQVTELFY